MFKNVIEGQPDYKKLNEYTKNELYWFIDNNILVELNMLTGICSEIIRRQKNENTQTEISG